ncbi:MAG: hypothetical protein WBC44_01280 [Planctomycetaceae bacterium]
MKVRNRRKLQLAAGTACWLAAGVLTFGPVMMSRAMAQQSGQTWGMSNPAANSTYTYTYTYTDDVDGDGTGPASADYEFQVREHGLQDVLVTDEGTVDTNGDWSGTCGAPDGGWPDGDANACLEVDSTVVAYVTISFAQSGGS